MCGPTGVRDFVVGEPPRPMAGMGWKSVGVLELTALPSIGAERWVPWVHEADVLLVDGGDATYLCHWMRESGLAELLSVTAGPGLGRRERREHGDDAAHRRRLRLLAVRAR